MLPVLLLTYVLIPVERSVYMDSVTGSEQHFTRVLGITTYQQTDWSPLAQRLRNANIAWTCDWRFLGSISNGCHACGHAPPILYYRVEQTDLAALSDGELRQLVQSMQGATDKQQEMLLQQKLNLPN